MSLKRSILPTLKVSIIVTTYNRARLLEERPLPSVLAQTYPHWECIVVDDGSEDGTPEVMRRFVAQDRRMRYIRLGSNRGLSAAANQGIREARGDFISFLDSDDAYLPTFLEELTGKLEALPDEYGGVASGAVVAHPNGWREYTVPSLSSFYTAVGNGMWLLRTSIFLRDGLFFDEGLGSDADADLGIRFFEKFKAKIVDRPLMLKYTHAPDHWTLTSDVPQRLAELEKFLVKHVKAFQTRGGPRELAWLYRFAGRNFCLGGDLRRGRQLFFKAFMTKPGLVPFFHLMAACGGSWLYWQYWKAEIWCARWWRSRASMRDKATL